MRARVTGGPPNPAPLTAAPPPVFGMRPRRLRRGRLHGCRCAWTRGRRPLGRRQPLPAPGIGASAPTPVSSPVGAPGPEGADPYVTGSRASAGLWGVGPPHRWQPRPSPAPSVRLDPRAPTPERSLSQSMVRLSLSPSQRSDLFTNLLLFVQHGRPFVHQARSVSSFCEANICSVGYIVSLHCCFDLFVQCDCFLSRKKLY